MRIKRFNENKEEEEKYKIRNITKDNEIWISKKDLQYMFGDLLKNIKEVDDSNGTDMDKKIKAAFVEIMSKLKEFVDDIGGNPRKAFDPYGEEEWDE